MDFHEDLRRHLLEELEQAFLDEVEAYREIHASSADCFAGMGVSSFFVLLCLILHASSVLVCNGGITSSFVRKVESSIDMPFANDVFRVPPGYNAPQQVYPLEGSMKFDGDYYRAGELSATELENLMMIVVNPRQFKIPDWFLNRKKDYKNCRYSKVVSNALDMTLRDDLERLKKRKFTQGDQVGRAMIISWVTVDELGLNIVVCWPENTKHKHSSKGTVLTYKYTSYISGYIHHCIIKKLKFDTKYLYEVGLGLTTRHFCFTTPPQIGPDVPYTFGLMVCLSVGLNIRAGNLGQTYDSEH
ncbi:hypothetical protein GIB67_021059 [Kingdonia uniflora]|uniref:Purple acid phosphatase N-terminal domain-containing protein n=1 Tax=Kingdonia uniflora TaxID=39325 RepID=A0A7J7N7A7_9MAGN|nr:hypothetical protein GIB67_021059 [Kingdonia uniflora]